MKPLITAIFLSISVWGSAQSSAFWFEQGTLFYNSQQYDSARVAFAAALNEGPHFASEYNLGNTYYRLGNLPHAILHWERAARLQPSEADVGINLALARTQLQDVIETQPTSGLVQWFQSPRTLRIFAWLAISIAVGIGLCTILRVLRPKHKRSWTAMAGLGGLLLLLIVILGTWATHGSTARATAILMAPKVDVYTAPAGQKVAFVLHAGTKMQILELQEGWIKVEIANGEVGWMVDEGYTSI